MSYLIIQNTEWKHNALGNTKYNFLSFNNKTSDYNLAGIEIQCILKYIHVFLFIYHHKGLPE